ncbi:MAG TPA: DUF502 domain-containing protein [Bacteroidota bacterium]|jgi:uncharacterized membrane protein|nr:DUF502 domain-containing protein [Bacteroidota bacterium]
MSDAGEQVFWKWLRSTFGRGLAVIVPIVITFLVLNVLFSAVDGIISPIFDHVFSEHIPGLGFMTMIVLIMIVGFLSRNLVGRTLGRVFERLIFSIPLARNIYSTMKDLMQIGGKGKSFRQVVLVEYPRQGVWTIGFATNEMSVRHSAGSEEMVSIYILNPPNPTSGVLVLVPRQHVQVLDMSVEDGLKLVLSGGIVTTGIIAVK